MNRKSDIDPKKASIIPENLESMGIEFMWFRIMIFKIMHIYIISG